MQYILSKDRRISWLQLLWTGLACLAATSFVSAAPGEWDRSFEPGFSRASAFVEQPDGKILFATHSYTDEQGQWWPAVYRLWPDGSLDASFSPNIARKSDGVDVSSEVSVLLKQRDGKLLIWGGFNYVDGMVPLGFARLNADGSRDPSFVPAQSGRIWWPVAVLPDGKILVWQAADEQGGQDQSLIRLHPDGTVDASFQLDLQGLRLSHFYTLALQVDGKILLAAVLSATSPQDFLRAQLIRLEADGRRDVLFAPVLRPEEPADSPLTITSLLQQPDGKILVAGSFPPYIGAPPRNILRLNPDGTLDETFQAETHGSVPSLQLQTDGKILFADNYWSNDSERVPKMARLYPDGSKDSGFNPPLSPIGWDVHWCSLLADGSILGAGAWMVEGFDEVVTLARFENDPATSMLSVLENGTLRWERGGSAPEVHWVVFEALASGSASWTPLGNGVRKNGGWELEQAAIPVRGMVRAVGLKGAAPFFPVEENLAVGGAAPELAVELPGGATVTNGDSVDSGAVWPGEQAELTLLLRNAGDSILHGAGIQLDGPHASDFQLIPLADTTLTPLGFTPFGVRFRPSVVGERSAVLTLTGGNVAGGPFILNITGRGRPELSPVFASPEDVPIRRDGFSLEGLALGAVTLGFVPEPGLALTVLENFSDIPFSGAFTDLPPGGMVSVRHGGNDYLFQADYQGGDSGKSLMLRLVTPGVVDTSLVINVRGNDVRALVEQSDGSLILGGDFDAFNERPRAKLARIFANGTLDPGFVTTVNGPVRCLAVQEDDKILVGGNFPIIAGQGQRNLARLHKDGSLDVSFAPEISSGSVFHLLVQTDGKILVGGQFEAVNGQPRPLLARLHPDGSLDASWNPSFASTLNPAQVAISCLSLQPDGKLIVGGQFNVVGGLGRHGLARLNTDGSVDASFHASHSFDAWSVATSTAVFPDGKLWAAKQSSTESLIPMLPDGSLDEAVKATAHQPFGVTNIIFPQADGTVLFGGSFTSFWTPDFDLQSRIPARHLARLLPDGSMDLTFHSGISGTGTYGGAYALKIARGGELYAGGAFTFPAQIRIRNMAKFHNGPVSSSLERAAPSSLLWRRGGAQEECLRVEFSAFDASTSAWTVLGSGSRVPEGWALPAATLPASGAVRARGFLGNGSQGIREEWLALGNAVPSLAVEDAKGAALLSGTGEVTFPPSLLGVARSVVFRLHNRGGGVLPTPVVSLGGPQAADFKVLNAPVIELGPQNTVDLVLEFNPRAGGIREAELAVSFPGQTGGAHLVSLRGQGMDGVDQWRTVHFGPIGNSGDAADSADPDHDGLPNLMEYAFGFDPRVDNSAQAPRWIHHGRTWELRVIPLPEATGVMCLAEWSPDLQPDSWQPIPNSGQPGELRFSVPTKSHPAFYVRWGVVRAP